MVGMKAVELDRAQHLQGLVGGNPWARGGSFRPARRNVVSLSWVAKLRHMASGEEHFLSPRHLVGRAPTCQLRIDDPGISGFHAELYWDGECWVLQDLGSRNGTVLGDTPLGMGEQRSLSRGTEVVLAGRVRLQLVDDSPPVLTAVASDGTVRIAEGELLSLPDDDEPMLTLYRELDGQWMVESETETRPLEASDTVITGGLSWRIISPQPIPATYEIVGSNLLRDHVLRLTVSRDGEHVQVGLRCDGQPEPIALDTRAHHLLLLALARERLSDAHNPDLHPNEQGWVYRDMLVERLEASDARVHLWIHRARKQLSEAGIRDAAAIIERRVNTAQLRLGTDRVEIEEH